MKNHFDEYISAISKIDLHPKLNIIFDKFPKSIDQLPNLIIHGPKGCGKYSQTLKLLKNYSPTNLKYEKKFSIVFNKQQIYYKISDIHYEIDMSLLGCNAKTLWHELYTQLIDIISAKSHKVGIIVCKYFHEIHSDLLEIFYSYMQKNDLLNISIKFILITEHISFLSDNILNCCHIIPIPRPSKSSYEKLVNTKLTVLSDIHNIADLENHNTIIPHKNICDKLLEQFDDYNKCDMAKYRELLYDLLTYNLNIYDCVWYIVGNVIKKYSLSTYDTSDIIINTYVFFNYYNNNYRPIYHLEKYIYYIICKIHNLKVISNNLDIL